MVTVATRAERQATIRDLATTCLTDADGDWTKAASAMGAQIRADKRLYKELMDPLVDGAVWNEIRRAASQSRRHFWSSATQPLVIGDPSSKQRDGLQALGRANLLDYPLSKGLKVGDAFSDQLTKEAEMYGAFAQANARTGVWLRLIAGSTPAGARVRDALTHDDLERLQHEAVAATA